MDWPSPPTSVVAALEALPDTQLILPRAADDSISVCEQLSPISASHDENEFNYTGDESALLLTPGVTYQSLSHKYSELLTLCKYFDTVGRHTSNRVLLQTIGNFASCPLRGIARSIHSEHAKAAPNARSSSCTPSWLCPCSTWPRRMTRLNCSTRCTITGRPPYSCLAAL